jgi:hypothetical protein
LRNKSDEEDSRDEGLQWRKKRQYCEKESEGKGNSTYKDLLEWPFVHLVEDGLDDVNGRDEGDKETSERSEGREGCKSASKGLTEPPLLLDHSRCRIHLLSVALEARPILLDSLEVVAAPSDSDGFLAKTPRLDEDDSPSRETETDERVEGETQQPHSRAESGREGQGAEVERKEGEVEGDLGADGSLDIVKLVLGNGDEVDGVLRRGDGRGGLVGEVSPAGEPLLVVGRIVGRED